MTVPISREEFKEYCLRTLGKPVIEINVSDEQVEDRITQALNWWFHNHDDGSELDYYKHVVTTDDITNGYITLPADVIGVSRVVPVSADMGGSGSSLMSFEFRMNLYEMMSVGGSDMALTSVYLAKQYHGELQRLFSTWPREEYTKYKRRLDILSGWGDKVGLRENDMIVVEVYRKVNVDDDDSVWSDYALTELATAMIKLQWGSNLSKYDGATLPSGITVNGAQLYAEAVEEIARIKEDIDTRWSPPPRFFVG